MITYRPSWQVGQDYARDSLSETEQAIKEELAGIGVIHRRKSTSTRFHPTQFSACLAGNAVAWSSAGSGLGRAAVAGGGGSSGSQSALSVRDRSTFNVGHSVTLTHPRVFWCLRLGPRRLRSSSRQTSGCTPTPSPSTPCALGHCRCAPPSHTLAVPHHRITLKPSHTSVSSLLAGAAALALHACRLPDAAPGRRDADTPVGERGLREGRDCR